MIDFYRCYRHFSKKRKVPFFIFIFSYFHYLSINKNIKDNDLNSIIKSNDIKIRYENIKENGILDRDVITIKKDYEGLPFSKKVIWHEIFHFYELKDNRRVLRVISETSANIFVYYKFNF